MKTEIQYWKTLANGYMIFVDAANMRIGIVLGLNANRNLTACTKRDFDTAFKNVLNILSQ